MNNKPKNYPRIKNCSLRSTLAESWCRRSCSEFGRPHSSRDPEAMLMNNLIQSTTSLSNLAIFGDFNFPAFDWVKSSSMNQKSQGAAYIFRNMASAIDSWTYRFQTQYGTVTNWTHILLLPTMDHSCREWLITMQCLLPKRSWLSTRPRLERRHNPKPRRSQLWLRNKISSGKPMDSNLNIPVERHISIMTNEANSKSPWITKNMKKSHK